MGGQKESTNCVFYFYRFENCIDKTFLGTFVKTLIFLLQHVKHSYFQTFFEKTQLFTLILIL